MSYAASDASERYLEVPDAHDFERQRNSWRLALAEDSEMHELALEIYRRADVHHFGYQWEWCGVPIIRVPDDIVLLQEIVWQVRPEAIIETGVARGGSVVLSASLMAMAGLKPAVLGLDIAIHPHTHEALSESPFGSAIELWEGDSASQEAHDVMAEFLAFNSRGNPSLLVLDSDHTHDHVLGELRRLTPLLAAGSVVLVADTIISELPADYFADRPWNVNSSPLTAMQQFVSEQTDFVQDHRWARRGLISEFRDGALVRVVDPI